MLTQEEAVEVRVMVRQGRGIREIARDLGVSRITATRYLDALAADGLLDKIRVGRSNYYVNRALIDLLRRGDAVQP